jgi:hypothetical protein
LLTVMAVMSDGKSEWSVWLKIQFSPPNLNTSSRGNIFPTFLFSNLTVT